METTEATKAGSPGFPEQMKKVGQILAMKKEITDYAEAHDDKMARSLVRATFNEDANWKGSIELIIGPMFSEKTTEMISRIRRASVADEYAVVIKWEKDTRYETGATIASHADIRQSSTKGSSSGAPIRVVIAKTLADVVLDEKEVVIGIDEGQFYPDLVEQCEKWARGGRRVIVAALDGDFMRRPFGHVCDLIPLCEVVEKRRGVCMECRSADSAFTQRFGDGTAIVQEGGSESYRSVCRWCYYHS